MDQKRSKVTVPPLADAQQFCLPSARVLSWNQSHPGCELPSVFEAPRITDGGDQRTGRDRPDTRNLLKLAAEFVFPMPCLDLCFKIQDMGVERFQMVDQLSHKQSKRSW